MWGLSMKKYKLGILGVGKMGSSILSGIINNDLYKKSDVLLFDVNEEIALKFKQDGFEISSNEINLFENVESVILAIKPQMFYKLKKYKYDNLNVTIISVAAGIDTKILKEIFGKQKFIRVMPNTPSLIGKGSTAISRSDNVDTITYNNVKKIFESIGIVEEINEDQMNEVIPANGSMPAFLYYFAKSFIENAVNQGIDYDVAKKLVVNSIIGSAEMIISTNKTIDELINDVCSPGGATLEGLKILDEANFKKIIDDAGNACIKRAYELSKLN